MRIDYSVILNFRNYEYITGYDMCCSMDLSMYANVLEDCNINLDGIGVSV